MKNIKTTSSKCKRVNTIFLEWSRSVTYHGFPKIFIAKTHVVARILWALVFACLFSLTSLILVKNIMAFYEYNVMSTIEVVNESPTQFPTITICDSNPFTTKKAEQIFRNISELIHGQDWEKTPYLEAMARVITTKDYIKQYVNVPEYGDKERQQLGFNLTDLVIECSFNRNPCDLRKDFHWLYHFEYGNCFQFNSAHIESNATIKEVTYEGEMNGFSLALGPVVNKNAYPSTLTRGLKIFVHNQSYVPSYFDTALSLKPGEQTSIAVQRTFASHVPSPYSNCVDLSHGYPSDLYRFIVNANKTYR